MQKYKDNDNLPSSGLNTEKGNSEKEKYRGGYNPLAPQFIPGKPWREKRETKPTERQSKLGSCQQQRPQILPAFAHPLPQFELRPLTQHIPTEVWLKIYGYILAPRLIPIVSNLSGQLSCTAEGIPRNIFLNKASQMEMMKTHALSFKELLSKPILFNKNADILLLSNRTSLTTLSVKTKALNPSRRPQVKYLAIEYFGYP